MCRGDMLLVILMMKKLLKRFAKKNCKTQIKKQKSEINKLVIGRLETTQVGLSKLSDVVKDEVTRKTVYDELVKKVHTSDASSLVD